MKTVDGAGGAEKLYTHEILGLAIGLANFPRLEIAECSATVRSRSCGSTLTIDIVCDANGAVSNIGLGVTACAIGQAAAVVFAEQAAGKSLAQILSGENELARWLGGHAELPNWPGSQVLQHALDYPGRHEAILLPWRAAVEALSNT